MAVPAGTNLITGEVPPPDDEPKAPTGQADAPDVFPIWGLLDAGQQAAQLATLSDWVLWAVERYDLGDKIRPCWAAHSPAVEVLTALFQRWLEVYTRDGWGKTMNSGSARGYEALAWLEQLAGQTDRLAGGTFSYCNNAGVCGAADTMDPEWAAALESGAYPGPVAVTSALPIKPRQP